MVTGGTLRPGQVIHDVTNPTHIPAGTQIQKQLTGATPGGPGMYQVTFTCTMATGSFCEHSAGFDAMGNTVSIPGTTLASGTYAASTGLVSVTLASSTLGLVPGSSFTLSGISGTTTAGDLGKLNGSFIAGSGTTGTTLQYTAATGLGVTSITGGTVVAETEVTPPAASISSATYNSTSGLVTLTLNAARALVPGNNFTVSGATGTGAVGNINGQFVAGSGTTGTTVTYTIAPSLTMTITGGRVANLQQNGIEGMISHGNAALSDGTAVVGLSGTTLMLSRPPLLPITSATNLTFSSDANGIVVTPTGGAQLAQLTIQQFGDANYIATPADRYGCGILFEGNQTQISQSYIDFGVAPICMTASSAGAVLNDNVSLFNSNYGTQIVPSSPALIIMDGTGTVFLDKLQMSGQVQLFNMNSGIIPFTAGHITFVPSADVPLGPNNVISLLTTNASTNPQRIFTDPFFDGLGTNNAISFLSEAGGGWSCYTADQLTAIAGEQSILLANNTTGVCAGWTTPAMTILSGSSSSSTAATAKRRAAPARP
jgi:hypothetical protein